jgi:hypothetical protein
MEAAREALKPIRELHQPESCRSDDFDPECVDCNQLWPCDTAQLIYSSEELEQ